MPLTLISSQVSATSSSSQWFINFSTNPDEIQWSAALGRRHSVVGIEKKKPKKARGSRREDLLVIFRPRNFPAEYACQLLQRDASKCLHVADQGRPIIAYRGVLTPPLPPPPRAANFPTICKAALLIFHRAGGERKRARAKRPYRPCVSLKFATRRTSEWKFKSSALWNAFPLIFNGAPVYFTRRHADSCQSVGRIRLRIPAFPRHGINNRGYINFYPGSWSRGLLLRESNRGTLERWYRTTSPWQRSSRLVLRFSGERFFELN